MTDKELKELIEAELVDNPRDRALYNQLYEDLAKEDPELKLKEGFASNVIIKVKSQKRQIIQERFWISAGAVLFLFATLITLLLSNGLRIFQYMNSLVGYLVIFIALIFVFNFIEKKFLKSLPSK